MKFIVFVKDNGIWKMWGSKPWVLKQKDIKEFKKLWEDVCCIQEDLYFAIKEKIV